MVVLAGFVLVGTARTEPSAFAVPLDAHPSRAGPAHGGENEADARDAGFKLRARLVRLPDREETVDERSDAQRIGALGAALGLVGLSGSVLWLAGRRRRLFEPV